MLSLRGVSVTPRQGEGVLGNGEFACSAASREFLDHFAVGVARGKVHRRVDLRRVLAQRLVDQADGLKVGLPISAVQAPQARDGSGDVIILIRTWVLAHSAVCLALEYSAHALGEVFQQMQAHH